MSPVRDDEQDRRTISAATLFNDLLERANTNSPRDSYHKAKSPSITREAALPPNDISPIQATDFTHTTSKAKDTPINLSQRILEGFQSQHSHHRPPEASRTDSHPHSRPHSRHRSSRSSETVSALLLIATERLAQETLRANEAERQSSEILAKFKLAHHAKQRLEIDLQRAKDELGLFKIQLNIAQAEIHRAQEIVNKVDQQRADAEDEARRGREKIRKLLEERSVEVAMEEGRRLGYEEGIRQARDSETRRTSFRSTRDDDDDDDQVSYFSYQNDGQSTGSSRSLSTSVRSSSRKRQTSDTTTDAAHPIPPISTLPSTNHNQGPSSTSHPNDHPENIAVRPQSNEDSDMPIRPISIHNRSPTVSHRSFKLPPDGYIPTIGANSVISLPPPHELSIPVPPHPSATATSSKQNPSLSRLSEQPDRKLTPKSVDEDNSSRYPLSSHPINNRRNESTQIRPISEASGASTSSLLGPPNYNDIGGKENNEEIDYFTEGVRRTYLASRASTQSKRSASKRRVNPDIILPPSPSPPQSSFLDKKYNQSTSNMQGNFIIERPASTDPSQRPQSRSSKRPREIVLPTPLIGTLLNPSIAHNPNGAHNVTPLSPRPQFVHMVSNASVPGIEIETPSSTTPSVRTVINPGLLSPESARSPPLPQSPPEIAPTPNLGVFYFNQPSSTDEQRMISMVLPDNNLPPGFIPLSPIPGMKNLDVYPSGFAPSVSKLQDEYPGGHLPPDFSYPSSPLIKSK